MPFAGNEFVRNGHSFVNSLPSKPVHTFRADKFVSEVSQNGTMRIVSAGASGLLGDGNGRRLGDKALSGNAAPSVMLAAHRFAHHKPLVSGKQQLRGGQSDFDRQSRSWRGATSMRDLVKQRLVITEPY